MMQREQSDACVKQACCELIKKSKETRKIAIMGADVKQFISYKDIIKGIEVNGFLDEKSFCGNFEVRLSSGQKVTKRGVFKRVHNFTRENFIMDFSKYVEAE